jgi:hypothetical protein
LVALIKIGSSLSKSCIYSAKTKDKIACNINSGPKYPKEAQKWPPNQDLEEMPQVPQELDMPSPVYAAPAIGYNRRKKYNIKK